jgi:hypothetical protein
MLRPTEDVAAATKTGLHLGLLTACSALVQENAPSFSARQKSSLVTLLYETALDQPDSARALWLESKSSAIAALAQVS